MGKKNGNIQFISRIERAMEGEGMMSTNQIHDKLLNQMQFNGRMYQRQPTMNQLVNLLSKNKQFKKCENNGMSATLNGSPYAVVQWQLDEREKNEEDAIVS